MRRETARCRSARLFLGEGIDDIVGSARTSENELANGGNKTGEESVEGL